MSDHVVQLAPAAEGDIGDAILWYRERNALIADAFRAEVFDTIDRITDAPLAKRRTKREIASACCIDFHTRWSTRCWEAL